jgi:hypothetical protein
MRERGESGDGLFVVHTAMLQQLLYYAIYESGLRIQALRPAPRGAPIWRRPHVSRRRRDTQMGEVLKRVEELPHARFIEAYERFVFHMMQAAQAHGGW